MASKKDLVEAYAFNRRRLVTTFLSGAPGGREVEPVGYVGVLIGGLVLALLVVAGAAVSGFLKPATPKKWDQALIIGKDTGSRFVFADDTLYPVSNMASARLFAATEGKLQVLTVGSDEIAKYKVGAAIGIRSAPDELPASDQLIDSGWVSCVNSQGGIYTEIRKRSRATRNDSAAVLVEDDARRVPYLIADGRRYQLPARGKGATEVRNLGLDGESLERVDKSWVSLFPLGSDLKPFTVPQQGEEIETGIDDLTRIGQPVSFEGKPYVLVENDGKPALLKLSWFANRMYLTGASYSITKLTFSDARRLPTLTNKELDVYPTDWPTTGELTGTDERCALLHRDKDGSSRTVLARPTDPDVIPEEDTADANVRVSSGNGALVMATSGGAEKGPNVGLIDSTGTNFSVGGTGGSAKALMRLGYSKVKTPGVPSVWLSLFQRGPTLSIEGARRPPGSGS